MKNPPTTPGTVNAAMVVQGATVELRPLAGSSSTSSDGRGGSAVATRALCIAQ
jgi:hypothetical protein